MERRLNNHPDNKMKYCFCTLALGRKYAYLSKQLAGDLKRFNPEVKLVVLTDYPELLEGDKNIIAVAHKKRSVMGYNDKLCVVNTSLEIAETCILLDADMRILAPVHLDDSVFTPGIKAYRIRSWEYSILEANTGEAASWKKDNLRIMRLLRAKYHLQQADSDIPFIVEFLVAFTRHDKMAEFLRTWNEIAVFSEKNGMFIHEGFSIGLAALLTGYPYCEAHFKGFKFFEPYISYQELVDGLITQEEYDALYPSISQFKFKEYEVGGLTGVINKVKRRLNRYQRFLTVRLFGLDLLS